MKAIEPITITDSILNSTNVAETDEDVWSGATAYVVDDVVMKTTGVHKRYVCIQNNTNQDPETETAYWTELGATNAWKMFDSKTGSQTSNANTIEVEIEPGELFNGIGFFGLQADTIDIVVTDPTEGEVYNESYDLADLTEIVDYYEWFFYPLENKSLYVVVDLPSYTAGVIEITIDNGTDTALCGQCVVGRVREFGETLYGTTVGIADYSQKTVDQEGNYTITEKKAADTVDYRVKVNKYMVRAAQKFLRENRAKAIAYIGKEELEATLVFGFFKGFSIVFEGPVKAELNIQIEELS